jgi:hypothetical protein
MACDLTWTCEMSVACMGEFTGGGGGGGGGEVR